MDAIETLYLNAEMIGYNKWARIGTILIGPPEQLPSEKELLFNGLFPSSESCMTILDNIWKIYDTLKLFGLELYLDSFCEPNISLGNETFISAKTRGQCLYLGSEFVEFFPVIDLTKITEEEGMKIYQEGQKLLDSFYTLSTQEGRLNFIRKLQRKLNKSNISESDIEAELNLSRDASELPF